MIFGNPIALWLKWKYPK
ncbi:hypothetical protein CP02DC22_1149A, partial [Chlamydia psittaci 02DC22]